MIVWLGKIFDKFHGISIKPCIKVYCRNILAADCCFCQWYEIPLTKLGKNGTGLIRNFLLTEGRVSNDKLQSVNTVCHIFPGGCYKHVN